MKFDKRKCVNDLKAVLEKNNCSSYVLAIGNEDLEIFSFTSIGNGNFEYIGTMIAGLIIDAQSRGIDVFSMVEDLKRAGARIENFGDH